VRSHVGPNRSSIRKLLLSICDSAEFLYVDPMGGFNFLGEHVKP
jgi:hypothetical protein